MKFTVVKEQTLKPDAFIIPVLSNLEVNGQVCETRGKLIQEYIDAKLFKGEKGEITVITKTCHDHVRYIILAGLGEKPCAKTVSKTLAKAVLKAQSLKATSLSVALDNVTSVFDENTLLKSLVAMGVAEYNFEVYKTSTKTTTIDQVEVVLDLPYAADVAKEAEILISGTNEARDLVNHPANVIKPESLAKRVVELGKEAGFEVQVYGKEEIEKFGMKAYLAVAQGADSQPQLIVMRYNNAKDKEKFAIVGKGLTYDTGGYSLKPSESMDTMKTDMGGSAATIGAMVAIAKAKLPVNVVGVVAACENMVSGHAIFPGDIVGSMCGKFIEVKNTDAEGRLTLIDAVHYAIKKEGASKVLDIATLTGAQIVALGDMYAGVLGNDEELMGRLLKASKDSGDDVWQLPYNEEVVARFKSKIADIINIGAVKGMGCSVGGAFVGEGVDGKPWVHVDIAGVAHLISAKDYIKEGATGFGVGLIYQLVKGL